MGTSEKSSITKKDIETANKILGVCYFYFLSNKRTDRKDRKIEKLIAKIFKGIEPTKIMK